jgi:Mat/Ecp fimbriae outer membrane usher protein
LGKGLLFAQTTAANENDVLMIGDLRYTPDTLAENTCGTQTAG